MKTLFTLILFIPFISQAAPFTSPKQVSGSQHLFRGAQPLGKADHLRSEAIETVVIFKNDVRGEVVREISELKEAGYQDSQIHHIPMKWKDIVLVQSCQQTITALQVLMKAEREETNTYFHCTAGEDRTGMIAALSRMLLTGESAEQVFSDEMCANSYSDGNPNKPANVTSEIEKGLTPLFFALAERIEDGSLNTENLLPQFCAKLKVKTILRKCQAN